MGQIHPTAVISPRAEIGTGVHIGPYVIIDDDARIGDGSRLGPHVVIGKWTLIGQRNEIHAGAVLGTESQDLKYRGERSYCVIGDDNVIREFVTINRSSTQDGKTLVGDGNVIMTYSHIAHDCVVANRTTISMHSTLAGHVLLEDEVFLEDHVGIHQFCRIGKLAVIGSETKVTKDVPPFIRAAGVPFGIERVNDEGLERAGLAPELCGAIRLAFDLFYSPGKTVSQCIEDIQREVPMFPEIQQFVDFLKNPSRRGICRKARGEADDEEGD